MTPKCKSQLSSTGTSRSFFRTHASLALPASPPLNEAIRKDPWFSGLVLFYRGYGRDNTGIRQVKLLLML
jgi:hypothetical protein